MLSKDSHVALSHGAVLLRTRATEVSQSQMTRMARMWLMLNGAISMGVRSAGAGEGQVILLNNLNCVRMKIIAILSIDAISVKPVNQYSSECRVAFLSGLIGREGV
jgi:hypothetical protein